MARKPTEPETTPLEEAQDEILFLKDQLKSLRSEHTRLGKSYANIRQFREELFQSVEALPKYRPMRVPKRRAQSPEADYVIFLSDWHTGLAFPGDEVGYFNTYNWVIAQARRKRLWTKIAHHVEVMRHAYRIDRCHILCLGDFVNGALRDESLMYDEFAPPEQAIRAGRALGEFAWEVGKFFPETNLHYLSTDNHGRLTKKVQSQGRAAWSWNPVVFAMVEATLGSREGIRLQEHPYVHMDVPIMGRIFWCEHGNDVRSWMGIPYYGLDRRRKAESERRARFKKEPYDYHVIGHWHTWSTGENWLMNPSLCGVTPHDHSCVRGSAPAQAVCLVSRHGWHGHTNFDLSSAV